MGFIVLVDKNMPYIRCAVVREVKVTEVIGMVEGHERKMANKSGTTYLALSCVT